MRKSFVFTCVMVLALFSPVPAHAYIDPGSASLAIQAVIAAIAGAGFFLRTKLYVIKAWLCQLMRGKKRCKSKKHSE